LRDTLLKMEKDFNQLLVDETRLLRIP